MNILFVHQLFPSQFKFLAPALAEMGHTVYALTMNQDLIYGCKGVKVVSYSIGRGSSAEIHPWVANFETKIIRAEYCFLKAEELKRNGFFPDVIIAHPGWGESLFLKEVWPQAKMGIYCEYYYRTTNSDLDFDPEFGEIDPQDRCKASLKNSIQQLHFEIADAAISPTQFQKQTYPDWFQSKISVIHEGVDTNIVKPHPNSSITINDTLTLNTNDQVITFVNRSLEPYRGYHSFMRAIPDILDANPESYILIIGGSGKGYGPLPETGGSWMDLFYSEVKNANPETPWNRVFFLGNLEYDVYLSVIQLSSVHVYLTYPFVLSWSLLEAMSAAKAIVASDTKPVQELSNHSTTMKLVSFFDSQELSAEISALLRNDSLRTNLGQSARAFILENYDLKTVCLPRQIEWVDALAKL